MQDRTACACGSKKFTADMTVKLTHVPVEIKRRGLLLDYDDTKGRSEGWDCGDDPCLTCAKCGTKWLICRRRSQKGIIYYLESP